ncbi:hypothetical protein AB6A40_011044 [Gnathostoma spinigerum]|uniref:Uncharacterized protein n=1 Tax=Gnathostoma spinigerum TaxID=75299 RepID=A0ABD6EWM1_9BILA
MDEGDEYVPQISQLDYSLVGGSGGPPIGIQNDPGGMLGNLGGAQMSSSTLSMSYGGGDMTVLQQQQTAQQRPLHSQLPSHASQITGMPPSMMDSSAGPMLTSGSHAQSMKTKPARRRKAANNDLCVQSAASSQQTTQRYIEMSQMQGLTQMSQNPLVDQQMRHHSMQVPMQLGKPAGEMHMRQASMTPRVLDPYSQQQQQWGTYQQFRGAPGYPTQQPYTTPNAPHGVQITPPQHQYYPVQQDSRVPAYYGQQTYPHQMAQYPSQIGPPQPVQPSQQYFMDQNNGYYTSPSQMMLPPQPQNMASFHSRNATGADDWSRSKVASRYNASPAPPHYQNSLQMEIQQVQQQLQSMYDIPNRTMQIAQQIEQLQLRLQYLQQCHAECIPPTHQLQPPHAPESQQSQPVSVMQRGSEVQVCFSRKLIVPFSIC